LAFPDTRQSVLLRVRSEDPRERARALDVVVAVYWQPVFRHVRARWRLGGLEAEDVAQGFFAAALEKGWLERFDPARGRFRSYLLACLDGHVAHELRAAAALKRGGGAVFVPLETTGDDGEVRERPLPDGFDPDAGFQREWARSVFARALTALESRCVAAGKPVAFAVFLRCDVEGAEAGERPSYARLAEEFALSVAQVTNHLHWVRRELRAVVLETLREITAGEQEFRAEVRALLGVDPP
jgi:DNA-directed RNA polymerase specialized sigma24 family protein